MLDALGGNDAIDGTVDLILAQALVDGIVVVENLDLHAIVGSIDAVLGADADAVVDARTHKAELKAENEVGVFLVGVEVAVGSVVGTDVDSTVDGQVVGFTAVPLVEVRAVEEQFKASLLFFRRELGDLSRDGIRVVDNLGQDGIHLVHGISGIGVLGVALEHVLRLEEHVADVSTALQGLVLLDEVCHGMSGGEVVGFHVHVLGCQVQGGFVAECAEGGDELVGGGCCGFHLQSLLEELVLVDTGPVGTLDEGESTAKQVVAACGIGGGKAHQGRHDIAAVHLQESGACGRSGAAAGN